MTTALTYDKIERNAYDNLFSLLNNRSNVADPRNRPTSSPFVIDYDPLDTISTSLDFNIYPYIMVGFPEEVTPSQKSTDGSTKRYTIVHTITVRTLRMGASGHKSETTGRNDLLDISSSLHKFFNNPSIRNQFSSLVMRNILFTKISSETITTDTSTVYEAVFRLEYSARMNVIA